MLPYFLKCTKNRNTESKNLQVEKIKNGKIMLLSNSAVCGSKKSRFVKEQEARGLLSKLTGIRVPILSDLSIGNMNTIVKKLLLSGDKFMPEMHLMQSGFTCAIH